MGLSFGMERAFPTHLSIVCHGTRVVRNLEPMETQSGHRTSATSTGEMMSKASADGCNLTHVNPLPLAAALASALLLTGAFICKSSIRLLVQPKAHLSLSRLVSLLQLAVALVHSKQILVEHTRTGERWSQMAAIEVHRGAATLTSPWA